MAPIRSNPTQPPAPSTGARGPATPAGTNPSPAPVQGTQTAVGGWTPATRKLRGGLESEALATGEAAAQALRGDPAATPQKSKHVQSSIVADVGDANMPTIEEYIRAAEALPPLRAGEAKLVAKLTPPQQRQYAEVSAAIDFQTPLAQVALIELLAEGTLQDTDSTGGSLLATLSSLATDASLAPGIDRKALLAHLVQEIAQPSCINQGPKSNNCGPVTVGIYLASTRPAEYGRIIAGLGSTTGTVAMVKGQLHRVEDTAADDGSFRSIPQRLLGPALMDFGNGEWAGFDNKADKNTVGGLPLIPGALPSAISYMLQGLLGSTTDLAGGLIFSGGAKAAMPRLEAMVAQDEPVPTLMTYGDGLLSLHWVLTTQVDKDNITFVNPWGREESMSREEYMKHLKGFVFVNNQSGE